VGVAAGKPSPMEVGPARFMALGVARALLAVWAERVGVMLGACKVGVGRPLVRWGMRLGVTTTEGTLGGGEPRIAALGEEFHRGRASMGISPPVPVPRALGGRTWAEDLDVGVKRGMLSRGSRDEADDVVDTERFRDEGVGNKLSLLRGGSEVTRLPGRMDEDSLEGAASGETCVKVVVLELLPSDRGLISVMTLNRWI